MFGSSQRHPGVGVASDTRAGHDEGLGGLMGWWSKTGTDLEEFGSVRRCCACGPGGRSRLARGPLEKEAKHLGVLTTV